MSRSYVCAYVSYLDALEALDDAERGRLFTAMLTYSATGEAPELTGNERFVWPMIRSQIDRDEEKYQSKCEKNRENAKKKSDTPCERSQAIADDGIPTGAKEKEKKKEKEKEKEKEKKENFQEKAAAARSMEAGRPAASLPEREDLFSAFWKEYPRKVGRLAEIPFARGREPPEKRRQVTDLSAA